MKMITRMVSFDETDDFDDEDEDRTRCFTLFYFTLSSFVAISYRPYQYRLESQLQVSDDKNNFIRKGRGWLTAKRRRIETGIGTKAARHFQYFPYGLSNNSFDVCMI